MKKIAIAVIILVIFDTAFAGEISLNECLMKLDDFRISPYLVVATRLQ
jgi:hypothetical protein